MADSVPSFEWGKVVSSFDLLLDAASPELFRVNAFRVTGLSVDATALDLSRQSELLKLIEKFGGGMGHLKMMDGLGGAIKQSGWLLPLDPQPEPDLIRDAIQRLRDPERRFIEEFFWFWPMRPGETATDQAIAMLGQGNIAGAVDFWTEQERNATGDVATHNLAVLSQAQALDIEHAGQTRPLNADERTRADSEWRSAYRRWKLVLEQDNFWTRVAQRIRDFEDPRLTEDTGKRARKSLALALLVTNAQLAARAAQRGYREDAQRQIALMRGSGFGVTLCEKALRRASEPVRERLYASCKQAEREAEADGENADRAAERLIEQTAPLLNTLDLFFGAGDTARDGAYDEVALKALRCLFPFARATGNWPVTRDILERALTIAVRESARATIEENLEVVRKNLWS